MLVIIRGAGDLATGIALRLKRAHISVIMTDIPAPTAIRRTVAFSQAIVLGETKVEDVPARRVETPEAAMALLQENVVPVLADPEGICIPVLKPDVVVDAILAKRNLGTRITDAPVVIGVGPGFTAGVDCHAVVETVRKYAKHYRIKSRNLAENSLDLVLELRTDEGGKLVREVMGLVGVTSASLLAHDGEVTF